MITEFTIPIKIAELPSSGLDIRRTLEEPQRQRLADRLAVKTLNKFAIDINIRIDNSKSVRVAVEGRLEATRGAKLLRDLGARDFQVLHPGVADI